MVETLRMGGFSDSQIILQALLAAGVPVEHASQAMNAVERLIDGRYADHVNRLATKDDIALTKSDIALSKAELRAEMTEFRAEFKKEIAELRTETKQDISEVRTELKLEFGDLRAEIDRRFALVDVRFAQLEARIAEMKSETLKWMFGAMAAQTGLIVGLLKLL
jgi:hypothetical protein